MSWPIGNFCWHLIAGLRKIGAMSLDELHRHGVSSVIGLKISVVVCAGCRTRNDFLSAADVGADQGSSVAIVESGSDPEVSGIDGGSFASGGYAEEGLAVFVVFEKGTVGIVAKGDVVVLEIAVFDNLSEQGRANAEECYRKEFLHSTKVRESKGV